MNWENYFLRIKYYLHLFFNFLSFKTTNRYSVHFSEEEEFSMIEEQTNLDD
jgi:hypothetical protein